MIERAEFEWPAVVRLGATRWDPCQQRRDRLLGYGVSRVCFVLSLRHLGTARTAAYFSTSPFVDAVLGVLFSESRCQGG